MPAVATNHFTVLVELRFGLSKQAAQRSREPA